MHAPGRALDFTDIVAARTVALKRFFLIGG
jgi:hypothetical protein